ncbi:hypothetical protein G6F43_003613 [Rhizopus delemar]|nr:hypothetical protein G6F43_003613 [Rhizopus delemar]
MDNIDQFVEQVLNIDNSKSPSDIRKDLEYTKSVEATLNRIFDGEFLQGIKTSNKPDNALVILDSDEEDISLSNSQTSSQQINRYIDNIFDQPVLKPKSKEEIENTDDILSSSSSKNKTKSTANKSNKLLATEDIQITARPFELFVDETNNRKRIKGKEKESSSIPKDYTQIKDLEVISDDEDLLTLGKLDSPAKEDVDLFENNSNIDLLSFDDDLNSPAEINEDIFNFTDADDILLTKETPKRKVSTDNDENQTSLFEGASNHKRIKSKNTDDSSFFNKTPAASPSTNVCLDEKEDVLPFSIDDSDEEDADMVHLPTSDEFFDDLLSLEEDKDIIEIDSPEDTIIEDRKGKKRAHTYSTNISRSRSGSSSSIELFSTRKSNELTPKEKKRLEAEERKRKRQELAEEKKRQKELKQQEKERQMLYEKENRIRNNRDEILKEMIVDIHPNFRLTNAGKLLEAALKKKLAEVHSLLDQEKDNPRYTIAWRRKCSAEWNTDSQTFIPLEKMNIIKEPFVLIYMHIDELNELIQSETIYNHIKQIQQSVKDDQILLLIEGLEPYYKKRALLQKRIFDNQVRQNIQDINTVAASSSRRVRGVEDIEKLPSRETIEQCLNELQILHDIMIVPTKNDEDTASWIESLTTDLALGRYKSKNMNNIYKGIKSGADPNDTYSKMLQEIQLCTPAVAKSVMNEYPTIQLLHQKYKELDQPTGEMLLSSLEVERSALQARDRTINRVMSKKIYSIFNSDDPDLFLY